MSEIQDIYPLSHMQKGMLFQSLLDTTGQMYFEQLILEIQGPLDISAFAGAWKSVIAMHPVLRTVFDWDGDEPVQIVLDDIEFPFSSNDAGALSQEKIARDHATDLGRPFDLERGPLIRFRLLRLDECRHLFRLSYHHIILDGASIRLILDDFAESYRALRRVGWVQRRAPESYKSYISWLLARGDTGAKAFWRRYLDGHLDSTRLPTSDAPSRAGEAVAAYLQGKLSAKVASDLGRLAKEHHLTLNNLLQTSWALLLHEFTGASDIVFGATTSGRPPELRGAEDMVGLFINTVPVRVLVDGRKTFLDHARTLQANWVEMQGAEHLPLFEIKKLLQAPAKGDPFQTIFVFGGQALSASQALDLGEIRMRVVQYQELTNYDLCVDVVVDDGVEVQFCYPCTRLDALLAEDLFRGFDRLVTALAGAPTSPVGTLLAAPRTAMVAATDHPGAPAEQPASGAGERALGAATPVERVIRDIWSEILGIADIAVDEDFFALGGDSISCIRVVSRLIHKGYETSVKQVFEHPTVRELGSVVTRGGETQRERGDGFTLPQSTRAELSAAYGGNIEEVFPASYVQKQVIEAVLKRRTTLFHDQSSFDYEGEINYEAFREAWNHTIFINPALRTLFRGSGSDLLQVVMRDMSMPLEIVDLRGVDRAAQNVLIEHRKAEDLSRGFAVDREPLLRATLFRLADDRHVFLLSFHVTVMDGWCFAFVLYDFYESYKALVSSGPLPAPRRGQYREYVEWLRRQDLDQALGYWREYLAGADFSPSIARDRRKDLSQEYVVSSQSIVIPDGVADALEGLAMRNRLTLNGILHACWATVLHESSPRSSVVFGATVSGRPAALEDSDTIVGMFFNDLPVHARMEPACSALELARRIQGEFSASRAHEYVNAQQIKSALHLLAETELFQTLLVFENYPKQVELYLKSEEKELLRESGNWRREVSDIDMTVYIERGQHLSVKIRYLSELFDAEKVRALLVSFAEAITKVAAG